MECEEDGSEMELGGFVLYDSIGGKLEISQFIRAEYARLRGRCNSGCR